MNKRLKDQTIKDNFVFAATMMVGDNCKDLLEMVLGFKIAEVKVSNEKTIVYNPECRGIRLDVFAEDENRTRYNVEMQVSKVHIPRRCRYYHSQIDMEMLRSGEEYETIPD